MRTRQHDQRGESLVEIVIAIVIMGIVVSALFAAFATAGTASKNTRDLVSADAALRNAAELVENTVRSSCATPGSTYTVNFTAPSYPALPAGFTPPAAITGQQCPLVSGPLSNQVPVLTLSVTLPNGIVKSLKVGVRSP